MTAKEKARELYEKFMQIEPMMMSETGMMCHSMAKMCAMVTADRVIEDLDVYSPFGSRVEFWREVELEIENI